jgi:hypothetical protein
MNDELKKDPRIEDLLSRIEPRPPFSDVNWSALEARILRATAGRIVALPPTWIDYTARWARAAIPLAVAAILALAVWIPRSSDVVTGEDVAGVETFDDAAPRVSGRDAVTLAFTGEVAIDEIVDAVSSPTSQDWIASGVMGGADVR